MCPSCGYRAVYLSGQTHDLMEHAGAGRASAGIEFSTRKNARAQPKSLLAEWLSSLRI